MLIIPLCMVINDHGKLETGKHHTSLLTAAICPSVIQVSVTTSVRGPPPRYSITTHSSSVPTTGGCVRTLSGTRRSKDPLLSETGRSKQAHGRRGTAISGIRPSRSRYLENHRDKWNPKKHCILAFLAGFPCLKQAPNLLRATLSLHKRL